jgi:hypothetical protein
MTTSSYVLFLSLAIIFGVAAGITKVLLARLRNKRKAQAPLLGVVLPNTQNLVSKHNLKHKDEI